MDSDVTGRLDQLLQALGTDPILGALIVLAMPIALGTLRAMHTLASGWHTRRKEFMEQYEKLGAGDPDPIMIEIAIRHGFGVWLPARAIQRIRQLPCPTQCIFMLARVLPFLEANEAEGTFEVKRRFASDSRRRLQSVLFFAAYLLFSMVFAFMLGALREVADAISLLLRVVYGLSSMVAAAYFLDQAFELRKLSTFVARYPALLAPVVAGNASAATPPSKRRDSAASKPRA